MIIAKSEESKPVPAMHMQNTLYEMAEMKAISRDVTNGKITSLDAALSRVQASITDAPDAEVLPAVPAQP